MKPTRNDLIEYYILHSSGIFKLDNEFMPIGIMELGYEDGTFVEYKEADLWQMFLDISFWVKKFMGPARGNAINHLINGFEKDLESVLDRWRLSPDDFKPHYGNMVKEAKKQLKRYTEENTVISAHEKRMTRKNARRNDMVYQIHKIFKNYNIKKTITDINYHIADILIVCLYETAPRETVFGKLDRAYHRYLKP